MTQIAHILNVINNIMEEKLLKRLRESVQFAKENGDWDTDSSWNYQEGILLSYKEAQFIINKLTELKKEKEKICPECKNPYPRRHVDGTNSCDDCGHKWATLNN